MQRVEGNGRIRMERMEVALRTKQSSYLFIFFKYFKSNKNKPRFFNNRMFYVIDIERYLPATILDFLFEGIIQCKRVGEKTGNL